MLDLLRSYAERTGHTRVPAQHRDGGFHLGWMVVYLRGRYRQDLLSPERVRVLEGVPGWSWQPLEDRFEHGLRLLKEFTAREGHACVPRRHVERGFALGVWVMQMRQNRRLGRLTRARQLERLCGWTWNARSSKSPRTENAGTEARVTRKEDA